MYETMSLRVLVEPEAGGDATRGGIEPAEEGVAGGAQEARCLPVGSDCDVEADEDWRPHPQIRQGAKTSGLEQIAMMA